MTTSTSLVGRGLLLSLALCLLVPLAAWGDDPGKKEELPAGEKRVRDLLTLKIGFTDYVLTSDSFPEMVFDQAAKAKYPFQVQPAFFNRAFEPNKEAKQPGLYGANPAVVADTEQFVRSFTLYRTNSPVRPDWKFTPETAKELAEWAKLDLKVVEAQSTLIAETLKNRPFSEFKSDPRVARLLAGLSLADPAVKATRKNDDAFALERQWWVNLKRSRNKIDATFNKPVLAPDAIEGKPAPVVREGTLEEAGMKPDTVKNLDAIATEWAADDDQAFAVCIVRKGVIVLHKAYGTRDGQPMTVDTKSWMASITKPMCASCMMMLVDRGVVKLDVPIATYLPVLEGIKVAQPITIRHCYTHTAGLGKWPSELYNDEAPDIESRIALAYPHLQVGKEWAYSGQSYTLAGKIIESVSGEAMPLFYLKHFLNPLGMKNTDVTGTHADARAYRSTSPTSGKCCSTKGVTATGVSSKKRRSKKCCPRN